MSGKGKKVYVGLSGGVDSSVAAALLKRDGYDVTGVFIRAWHPDFLVCDWRGERQYAMRVCACLNISFETFDFEKEYKKEVADYMIAEYEAGRTPNPDVMCNKRIKFGLFLEEALKRGADFVATGHYARLRRETSSPKSGAPKKPKADAEYKLLAGVDKEKDQSYFLWTLKQEQLKSVLFPVGRMEKKEVRKIAADFGLPTAEKKDSQGLCFLGQVDMEDFLKKYLPKKKGPVEDVSGKVIGEHDGVYFYTIGQRHGFEVRQRSSEERPYYIVGKNRDRNAIIVSNSPAEKPEGLSSKIFLEDLNWVRLSPEEGKEYGARIRYRQPFQKVSLKAEEAGMAAEFKVPQKAVSAGQSAVFYDGEEVLGGGVIK